MEARPTALGLWIHTDPHGRCELIPELIAGAIYPGEAATDRVLEHVLMLAESGFLTMYQTDDGREWISLAAPLKADMRSVPPSQCPPPPDQDLSRHVVAVGGAGARERARARARASVAQEQAARASSWAAWDENPPQRPERPMLIDAPPLGCPEHPHGTFKDCGPCGTARRRHDRWVAQERYTDQLADYEEGQGPRDYDEEEIF